MAIEGIGFDWTVNFGNVMTLGSFIAAFSWFLVSTRFRLETIERDLKNANGASQIRRDLDVIVARSDATLAGLSDRVNTISRRVDDMNNDLRAHQLEYSSRK